MRTGLLLVALVGCGSGNGGNGGGGNGKDTGSAGATCPVEGTLGGCLIYEGDDCTTNSALDGLPGGWFNDDGSDLVIGFARTNEGLDIRLTVPNAGNFGDAQEWMIPTEVLVELTDTSGPEPVLYYACNGTMRIPNYTPGELLWVTAMFQARGPMGICGDTDYFTVGADLINASYCKL